MMKFKQLMYVIVAVWIAGVFFYFFNSVPEADYRNIRIEQTFALTGLLFLYCSLLINPLSRLWSTFGPSLKSIQPTLVALTFVFGLMHGSIAFFFLLGGFEGLGFLNQKFILGITLSTTSLVLLGILAYLENLVQNWQVPKWLGIILCLIGTLITIHALLLGSHFIDISATIPKIFFVGLAIFLILEAVRLDQFMARKFEMPKLGINLVLLAVVLGALGFYYFNPNTTLPSASIHSMHMNMNMPNQNSTKRYTVSLSTEPTAARPGQNVNLKFRVYDADTGASVDKYDIIFEKLLHLVVVDSNLGYFNHIHPELVGSEFVITTQFPKNDLYRLYLNFQPSGGAEQQIAFTLPVGVTATSAPLPVDTNLSKTFGNHSITLSTDDGSDFNAQFMSDASQVLNFHFEDATTSEPIDDLEPYLGAFGHLVLINQQTYQYVHVHPLAAANPNAGGPDVKFLPAALHSRIEPGIYRVFGQFQRNGEVFVADYTIEVK